MSPDIQKALIGVAGTIVGCVLTFLLSSSVRERMAIKIYVAPIENLTEELEQVGLNLMLNGQRSMVGSIRRVEFGVLNIGNRAVKEFNVDVSLNSEGKFITKLHGSNAILSTYSCVKSGLSEAHRFRYPYLNPKEQIREVLYFDTSADECQIGCRQPDLKVSVVRATNFQTIMDFAAEALDVSFNPLTICILVVQKLVRGRFIG